MIHDTKQSLVVWVLIAVLFGLLIWLAGQGEAESRGERTCDPSGENCCDLPELLRLTRWYLTHAQLPGDSGELSISTQTICAACECGLPTQTAYYQCKAHEAEQNAQVYREAMQQRTALLTLLDHCDREDK